MKFWILQTGEPLYGDSKNFRAMRAINLSDALISKGHKVVIWSSKFNHQKKIFRDYSYKKINENLEIILIDSPGYKKNISLKRLYDHFILSYNLKRKLRVVKELPDAAFIGFPPIETSYIMSKFLKINKVPFVLDVKDLWPDVFVIRAPGVLKYLVSLFFYPYFRLANSSFIKADSITAMSNSFIDKVLEKISRIKRSQDKAFPLVPKMNFNNSKESFLKDERFFWEKYDLFEDNSFKIIYVGSLSAIVNFTEIIEASKILSHKKYNVKFIICGDGELKNKFINACSDIDNIIFPGWVTQKQSYLLHQISQMSIIPYKNTEDFLLSLPNKTFDSISMGLPILSKLKGEMANFLKQNRIGKIYSNSAELSESIIHFYNNKDYLKSISQNSLNVYKKSFTFDIIYGGLVSHLENLKIVNE